MCTVIVALDPTREVALAVAANRDERLSRPSTPPAVRAHQGQTLLFPRDEVAKGTWWGLTPTGRFVAVTNRAGPQDRTRASRGQLVLDVLAAGSMEAAVHLARARGPDLYNPYHLMVLESVEGTVRGTVVWCDGATLHASPMAPGLHVVAERSFEAATDRRTPRVRAALAPVLDAGAATSPGALIAAMGAVLRLPGEGIEDAVNVRLDAHDYGSRSSSLLLMDRDGGVAMAHAEGVPGTPYVVLEGELDTLGGAAGGGGAPAPARAWMRAGLAALDGAPSQT